MRSETHPGYWIANVFYPAIFVRRAFAAALRPDEDPMPLLSDLPANLDAFPFVAPEALRRHAAS